MSLQRIILIYDCVHEVSPFIFIISKKVGAVEKKRIVRGKQEIQELERRRNSRETVKGERENW